MFAVCGNMYTAPIKIATLDEDGDLLLVPDFWQEVMEDQEAGRNFRVDHLRLRVRLYPVPAAVRFAVACFPRWLPLNVLVLVNEPPLRASAALRRAPFSFKRRLSSPTGFHRRATALA